MFDPDDDCCDLYCDKSDHPKIKRVVCFKVDGYLPGDAIYLEYDRRLNVNLHTDVGFDTDNLIDKL